MVHKNCDTANVGRLAWEMWKGKRKRKNGKKSESGVYAGHVRAGTIESSTPVLLESVTPFL